MTDLAEAALEAFTAGWVLAGAPLDERYPPRALAAVTLALDYADDPAVLETSLIIGKLQGAWAKVFGRREKLTAERIAVIIAIWRKMMPKLGLRDAIARWWRTAAILAADGNKAMTRDEATQAATGWLRGIVDTEGYPKLQAELTDALAASMAEGKAGALAVAAEQAGTKGASYSFDAAYKDYYAQLKDLPQLPLMTQEWIQRIIGGAANDVGRVLSSLAMDGAGADEMAGAVGDLLDAEDTGAVAMFTDWAMSDAMIQAALSLYTDENVASLDWLTAGDSRVCFPAGTPVATPGGEQPIETLRHGNLVLTPQGYLPIHGTGSRPYAGGLTSLKVKGRTVTATDDHPFWTPAGWREIGQLQPGDLVYTAEDEFAEVASIVHVALAEPNDVPPGARKLRVTPGVPLGGAGMPVLAVSLDGEPLPGHRKVDDPRADRVFLLKADPEMSKGLANANFQASLAAIPPVTGERAERPVCRYGDDAALFPAIQASGVDGRAPALLGAVMPVEMLLGTESLPAPLAVDVDGAGGFTGGRACGVPVGDARLDGEVLVADGAVLRDIVRPAGLVAVAGTERPRWIPAALRTEGLPAAPALPVGVDDRGGVITGARTECAALCDPSMAHEIFTAVGAFIAERHDGAESVLYVTGIKSIPVYDIEVEQAHVFYASSMLVHNCNTCQDYEDNSPYTPGSYPDIPHPRCRCSPAPTANLPISAFADYLTLIS